MAEHQLSSLTMLTEFFAAEQIEAAARRTGFVKRASKITGKIFLAFVTFGAWSDAQTTFAQLAAKVTQLDEHVDVSPEAIYQRMHKRAHAFLQEMIQHALAQTHAIASGCEDVFCTAFTKVYLADSTGFELPDRLKDTFPGSGGSAAQAGAKIQAVWDYKSSRFDHFALTAWNIPDQKYVDKVVALDQKGILFIFDLGYFKLKAFAHLATAGAYFLSRRNHQTTLLTSVGGQWQPLALANWLTTVEGQLLERPIFLGEKERVAARLIVARVPEAIVNERRRKARKNAQKKGYTPSHAHLTLLAWNLFITNVPSTIWQTATVLKVYPLRWHVELFQSHDIKCRRDAFFFLVGGHGLRFTGQDVMDCKRPIPRHPHCFSQPLDHGVPVFATPAVPMTAEQGAEGRASAGAMFPLHGRVTLRCDRGAFLRECLEPWRDLLPPGRQLLQGAPLRVRGVDAPRSLSLSMVSVEVHTRSVVLQLALLPLLDVLPQRVGLPHGLGMVPQVASQGPHERSASVGAPTPRWAAWRTARGAGILPGTLLIQRGGALPHAPWPCGRPRSLTRPTAHARPQPRALRGRRRRPARLFVMALPRRVRFPTDGGTNACGRRDRPPRLGRTTRTGRVRLPRVACAPGCLAWAPRCGLILRAVSGVEHLGKQAAHAGRMPSVIAASTRRERLRVEPLHEVARGPLCMAHPAT